LGISTEASKRFERGTDIEGLVRALDRTTQLILELAGGKAARGMLDMYPKPYVPKKVSLSHVNLEGVLGATVAPVKVNSILEGLGFAPQWDGEKWETTVPPFRAFDVSREIDLVEEVARVYGYNNIPSTMPSGPLPKEKVESQRPLIMETEAILSGLGLMEVVNYSFIDPRSLSALKLAASDPRLRLVVIKNPLSEEMSVMRTTLLPGLLNTALVNERAQIRDMALFEVGRVFLAGVPERLHVGILAMGKRGVSWDQKGQEYDFFFVKGVVEALVKRLKGLELQLEKGKEPFLHPGRSASLNIGGKSIGYIGEIHPQLARSYRFSQRCYVAELLLEVLEGEKRIEFEPLPRFPGSVRDLSLIAPMNLSHGRILATIQKLAPPHLREVNLIDHYIGPPVEAGKRGLTYSFLYRAEDRTLTDQEVEGEHGDLVKRLESVLPITIRR